MAATEVFTHAALVAKADELRRERSQSLALTIKRDFMLEFEFHLYARPQTPWQKRYKSDVVTIDARDLCRALRVHFPDIYISIVQEPLSPSFDITVTIDYSRLKAPEDL
jgi:hypothetical protein